MIRNQFSREKIGYMFGILSSPIESFYEIRYRNKGSVPLAILCVLVLSSLFTINRIFTGFIINNVNPQFVDGISEMAGFFVILGLFCVGNWSVTCLMEGEGRMRDIITVAGYAMLPAAIFLGPATIISNFVSLEEAAIYQIILGFGIIWTVILLIAGIMTVHNYTLVKTIITMFLTFLTMLILTFLGLLIIDLVNQMYGFVYSIYTELVFRF